MEMSEIEVRTLNDKLNKVLGYINNDHDTDTPGLVQQVRDIRKDLDELISSIKTERAQRRVWATVFGFVGAGILWLLKEAFHFLTK